MQPVPAASTYSGVLAKQTPILWRGIQPLLAPAFASKPYILDQMVTGAFFKTHVRSQALLPDGSLDGEILMKRNADVLCLADRVLFEVIQEIVNHTLDICHCSKTLTLPSAQPKDRLDGRENTASVDRDRNGKILSISFPNTTRERLPILKAMLLRERIVQRESDFEEISFYFGCEYDQTEVKVEKVVSLMNQLTDDLVRQVTPEQYFTLEADKVPALFLSRWKQPPHVRESDHKLVYAIKCSDTGKFITDRVADIRSGKYFRESISDYHIDPVHLPSVQEAFAKIGILVGNLVKKVPQCSLYLQDVVHSVEIFNQQNPSSTPRNCEEDAILFIASTIFFEEDRSVDRGASPESTKCLATQCLHFPSMGLVESLENMKQTLQRVAGRYQEVLQFLTELNDGRPLPDVL